MSTLGGGPGNLDLVKFADQVPAKPPGSISAALTVSETATREKAKIIRRIFMADMIIRIEWVSILFLRGSPWGRTNTDDILGGSSSMMVRVGVDASIDEAVLADFTKEVQLLRIPEEPQEDIEV